MKWTASLALLLAAASAQAQNQNPPATGTPPVTGAGASLASLLDSGYEIKSTYMLSDEDQKAIWPNDKVSPFMMVVLQKGPSLATCVISTTSMVNVSPAALGNPSICKKR